MLCERAWKTKIKRKEWIFKEDREGRGGWEGRSPTLLQKLNVRSRANRAWSASLQNEYRKLYVCTSMSAHMLAEYQPTDLIDPTIRFHEQISKKLSVFINYSKLNQPYRKQILNNRLSQNFFSSTVAFFILTRNMLHSSAIHSDNWVKTAWNTAEHSQIFGKISYVDV